MITEIRKISDKLEILKYLDLVRLAYNKTDTITENDKTFNRSFPVAMLEAETCRTPLIPSEEINGFGVWILSDNIEVGEKLAKGVYRNKRDASLYLWINLKNIGSEFPVNPSAEISNIVGLPVQDVTFGEDTFSQWSFAPNMLQHPYQCVKLDYSFDYLGDCVVSVESPIC